MVLSTKAKVGIAIVLVGCAVFITICIILGLGEDHTKTKQKPSDVYLECPVTETDKEICEQAGCIWRNETDLNAPSCTLPKDSKFGYAYQKEENNRKLHLKVNKGSFFGNSFENVIMTVSNINENVLRIKFEDSSSKRYEVPVPLNLNFPTPNEDRLQYKVDHERDPKSIFSFNVIRSGTGTKIFDSSVGSLFLAERHVEITTKLPSENVFGIGENTHTSFKHNLNFKKWPLFSRDQFPIPELGDLNLYGVHPFYTCLEKDGKSHGVLFLNSNAMEVMFTPMPSLTFRAAGGILDMYFFIGDNPEHVIQLYTEVIGRPMIPPYWSLGFQLSRYNYRTLENMKAAIERTRKVDIPLDVVHADIDHMENNKDFTWDKNRFPGFPEFIKEEKKKGLRVIIILDPALLASEDYAPYTEGRDKDVFIKWPEYIGKENRTNPPGLQSDKNILYGRVWPPGPVAFPDYFKKATKTWWETNIKEYRKELNFDAIWIDMNEPANFETDKESPWFCEADNKNCWTLKCPYTKYDSMENTFVPAAVTVHNLERLSDKTICMAAVQGENGELNHYDVHSLYGWSQTEITYKALKESAVEDQVPLVISRSTYPSSGRHTGHWLGDNRSTWEDLRNSIIGMLEFNLFGIPYVGADICGFFQNTTSELCGRWMQLGAFYPFSRNHNNNEARDQDPGSDIMEKEDIAKAKHALDTRYRLLPYLHTLHYLANKKGNTVVRPLFHEYPKDPKTYGIQEQFLWGPSLLISPALYKGQTEVKMYFPDDVWYDFYTGALMDEKTRGTTTVVKDTDMVPLHVRGGHILPLKENGAKHTKESREREFEIHVYPAKSSAVGSLFWMSEKAKDADDKRLYSTYDFVLENNQLIVNRTSATRLDKEKMIIRAFFIYGVNEMPTIVKYEETNLKENVGYIYDPLFRMLKILQKVDLNGAQPTYISWT